MESRSTWDEAAQAASLRRNYVAMVVDGGFYFGGIAFVAPESVLPAMLAALDGPTWLVALAPTLAMIGFFLGPLFTAHLVEQRAMLRPYVVWVSLPQRLPPLFAGLALLLAADRYPGLALWAVALSPLLISTFGGAVVAGFWELFAKIIPARRRSSNLAVRNVVGTLLGVSAGGVVAAILTRWPGATGYGLLHLCCFACLMLSWAALLCIREQPHVPSTRARGEGWTKTVRLLPRFWRTDRRMRGFVAARVFGFGIGVVTPFLAVHALRVTGESGAFLGELVVAQSVGAIAGNAVGGWLGDRFGGRIVAALGLAGGVVMCLAVLPAESRDWFLGIFFLLGGAKFLWMTGSNTLMLELFSGERRPTYVAITSILTLPAMFASAWLAGAMWSAFETIWPLALVGALLVGLGLVFLLTLPEPRREAAG